MRNRTRFLTIWKLLVVACLSLAQPAWAYYNPSTGRWLNRDPIGERGGANLTAFVANNPGNHHDPVGLALGDCCCRITLVIEVPGPHVRGKLNRKGMAGHTGVGIDEEYFDYGPEPGKGGSLFGSPGGPWWDNRPDLNASGDADLQDVLDHVGELSAGNDTYTVTAEVNPPECAQVRAYWEDLYDEPGTYRFYARQCTTTACKSLRKAGLLHGRAMKPNSFLSLVRERLKHTCGPKTGQPANVAQVHAGSVVPSPVQHPNLRTGRRATPGSP